MASVDVVVPCYNYAHFLGRCVSSILCQSGVDVRVLIIDDASQDDSAAVARRLAEEAYPRVEFIRHDMNRGHIDTYNEGLLEWASADYSLLLSADDMLAPGALARATRILDQYPQIAFAYGRCIGFVDEPPALTLDETDSTAVEIMRGEDFIARLYQEAANPVPTPTAIVRTEIQRRVGGYKKELPHSGDLEMWLRCAAQGDVARLQAVQGLKSEHVANMSKQFVQTAIRDLEQVKLAFELALSDIGDQAGNADRLLNQAIQTLSIKAFWNAHLQLEHGRSAICDELMDFALKLDPQWPHRPEWKRLVWKRRLGPTLGTAVSLLLARIRSQRKQS